ncbi:MAG TPA: hypothetical protein VI653_21005 [Steroidobacteraceae bacterium]
MTTENPKERRVYRGCEIVREEDALATLGDSVQPVPTPDPPRTRAAAAFAWGIVLGAVIGMALERWWHGGWQ